MDKNSKFKPKVPSLPLEYETQILNSDAYIVNRKNELECLTNKDFNNFIIFGVSCVGKTQLSKSVAKHYNDSNELVFWHKVYPQTSEMQTNGLLELFAAFLSAKLNDHSLNDYLKTHGVCFTNQLCVLIEHSLNQYRLHIFIDDMQNLEQGNNSIFQLFDIFMNNANCKFYISGWYITLPEQYTKKPKTMLVEVLPMNEEHIREVAKRIKSDISDEVLMLVVEKSEGLPGVAEIIPYSDTWREVNGLTDYFRNLLGTASTEERILLCSLAISPKALLRSKIAEAGYSEAYYALVNRHIVKEHEKHITLHDKYRDSLLKTVETVEESVVILLELCSSDEPSILINLLNFLCSIGKINEYAQILRKHFPTLLKQNFDVQLLASIQQASVSAKGYTLEFLVAKMILLERQAQYDTLGMLIDVTQDVITDSHVDYYMWQYVYLRYLYFKCEFIKILDYFYDNQELLSKYPTEIYLQILFIVGRTYFVIGDLRPAAEIYLFAFNTALSAKQNNLATKAIHRMCIIEEKLGLFKDTLNSLNILNDEKYLISAKRLSFSYYRRAKCFLGLGKLDEANESNNSSIEIKESLNSRRGLMFCHKLNSQIALSGENVQDALYWGQLAYTEALELGVEKEIIAASVTYARALLHDGDKQQAADILDAAIILGKKLCLLKRLKTIQDICIHNDLENLVLLSTQAITAITPEIDRITKRYAKEFRHIVKQKEKQFSLVDSLLSNKKTLSQRLLLIF